MAPLNVTVCRIESVLDGKFDLCLHALDTVDACALKMCELASEWYFGRLFPCRLCPFSRSSCPQRPRLCSALCLGVVFPAFDLYSTGMHSAWRNVSLKGETHGPVGSSPSAGVAGRKSNRTFSTWKHRVGFCDVNRF